MAIGADGNLREWGPVTDLVGGVLGWVQQWDLALAASPFPRYWTIGDENERFQEVGAPTEREASGDGRVKAGRVPAGSYATVVHVGIPIASEGPGIGWRGGSRTGA